MRAKIIDSLANQNYGWMPLTLCAFRAYGPFIISVGLMNCLLVVTALSEYPQLSPCITIGSDNGVPLL